MIISLLSLSKDFLASESSPKKTDNDTLVYVNINEKLKQAGFNDQQIITWFKLTTANRKEGLGLPLTESEQDILDKEDGKIKVS